MSDHNRAKNLSSIPAEDQGRTVLYIAHPLGGDVADFERAFAGRGRFDHGTLAVRAGRSAA